MEPRVPDPSRERGSLARVEAHPVHPRVELHVDADPRFTERPSGFSQSAQAALGVQRGRESGGEGVLLRTGGELGEHEDGRIDAGLAQSDPLLHQGHPEPRGPGSQRGRGDWHGAVAISVCLYHGHQLRGGWLKNSNVVPDGIQVDLGDRRPEPQPSPPSTPRTLLTASGKAPATSPDTAPSPNVSSAISPASPWR